MNSSIPKRSILLRIPLALSLPALLLALLWFVITPVAAANTTYYVDADATGSATGLSWTDAFTNVQDALGAAEATDQIWVAEGVYYPDEGSGQTDDDRNSTFALVDGVAVYGGFDGTETELSQRDWEAHITVLSGDLGQDDITDAHHIVTDTININGSNAYNVIKAHASPDTTVLDGFTITAGFADGNACPSSSLGATCGGGAVIYFSAEPTLSHLVFSGNYANMNGGGLTSWYSDVNATSLTFTGNSSGSSGNGGGLAIYRGTLTLTDSTFEDNIADYGGGLYYDNSVITVTNSTFISNTARRGGGLYGTSADDDNRTTLTDVTLVGNHAYETVFYGYGACNGGGGMCYRGGGMVTMTHVTFENNTTTRNGAALYIDNDDNGHANLNDVTFQSNTATYGGGALYNIHNALTLSDASFISNTVTSSADGGGLNNYTGTITITNSAFSGNSARLGGGLYVFMGSAALEDVTFDHNSASNNGGGIGSWNAATLALTHTTFTHNTSGGSGGGLVNYSDDIPMKLYDVTFEGNTASSSGGGMYNYGLAALENVAFYSNAANYGGGFYNYGNEYSTIDNAIFANNQAAVHGGGIYSTIDSTHYLTITNATIYSNTAGYQGGGISSNSGIAMISNSIIWGNSPYQVSASSTSSVLYSDIQGGYTGEGNLDAAPLFVNAAAGDFTLQFASPALDAGNDNYVTTATDYAGNPRIQDAAVDLGAYEQPHMILAFDKSVAPAGIIGYHGTVTYTLALSNTGSLEDPSAVITDSLPGGVTFGEWVYQPAGMSAGSNLISWTGTVAAGEMITASFTALHTGSYGDVITNTAQFSGIAQWGHRAAAFTVEPGYLLTVYKNGTGRGTVTSDPAGIACGAECESEYQDGTAITLTASPAAGSTFSGWSGACTGTGDCTVTMTEAQAVTATFTLIQYELSVAIAGTGRGTVTSDPAGISCGGDCSALFDEGTLVTLIASPAPESTFSGWSGACSGTADCTVTMTATQAVTATFTEATHYLIFLPLTIR